MAAQINAVVDLRSDTKSLPIPEMKQAMFDAVLGDDVHAEDPTVNELERKSAELLGKEAAVFVPTGTMANLIAAMVHCHRRGTEAIVGHLSHNFLYEQGGAAHIGGIQMTTIKNKPDGTFCLRKFEERIRGSDQHEPLTALAVVENTHNMCGGKAIPMAWLDEFTHICRANGIATHMDGARVFNAAWYLNVPAARIVRDVDSISFCLSKALCAPVGSMLLGSHSFVAAARRIRKALGGGMRQAGVLAAAGIVALDIVVPRLIDDHRRTRKIAQAVHDLNSPWVRVDVDGVHTNICLLKMVDPARFPAEQLIQRLAAVTDDEIADGVVDNDGKAIVLQIHRRNKQFARMVIYPGITDDEIDRAIRKLTYCISKITIDQ